MGPLPKHLRPEASEASRLAEARVLRVLEAFGKSSIRILRVWDALGDPRSKHPKTLGGSPFEAPKTSSFRAAHLYVFYVSWRLWEAHLYVFYVSGRLRGVHIPTS